MLAGATRFSVAELRADFTTLYRQLQDAHCDLHVRRLRPEYDALFERMLADITSPMTAGPGMAPAGSVLQLRTPPPAAYDVAS